jgi:hypothetical protein
MSKDRRNGTAKKEMLSFLLEEEFSKDARKMASDRMIPFSMWLREAAREKLRREKRSSPKAKA